MSRLFAINRQIATGRLTAINRTVVPLRAFLEGEELEAYIKAIANLIAYWPLNEASGNAINQAPATFGTFDGTVVGVTRGVDGHLGKAYSFDGNGDYVQINSAIGGSDSFSVGLIVKAAKPQTNSYPDIIHSRISMEVTGNNLGVVVNYSSTVYYLFVYTYDHTLGSNQRKTYVNGVLRAQSTGIVGTSSYVRFGAENTAGWGWFKGILQHVFMLNRAMTTTEISNLARVTGLG